MKKLLTLIAATAVAASAGAEIIDVAWDAQGRFGRELTVAPGKFVEACDKLPRGARVAWSFDAAAPLDFNIHYHEGEKLHFPARKAQVARDAGTLAAELAQDYCWMWTNKGSAPALLRLGLQRH